MGCVVSFHFYPSCLWSLGHQNNKECQMSPLPLWDTGESPKWKLCLIKEGQGGIDLLFSLFDSLIYRFQGVSAPILWIRLISKSSEPRCCHTTKILSFVAVKTTPTSVPLQLGSQPCISPGDSERQKLHPFYDLAFHFFLFNYKVS